MFILFLPPESPAARDVLLSVVSVCVFVCLSVYLFVCQHDNSLTVRDIVTKFSGHHLMIETAGKFDRGVQVVINVLIFQFYFSYS